MFSLLRRNNASASPSTSSAPPPPPPTLVEPPPPPSARRAKERSWLATISGKASGKSSSKVDRGVGHVVVAAAAPAASTGSGGRDKGKGREQDEGYAGPAGGGAPSLRSRRSFRIGGSKNRDKDPPPPSVHLNNNHRVSVDYSSRRPSSSAPPLSSPPLSSSSLSPPLLAPPSPPVPPSPNHLPTTLNLAARLQELAVANADGLLDDEEYRVLRAQLFESSVGKGAGGRGAGGEGLLEEQVRVAGEGGLAVPRLATLDGPRNSSSASSPPPPSSPPQPAPTLPSSPSLSARAPSVLSTQSRRASMLNLAGGLFRSNKAASVRSGVGPSVGDEHLRSPTLGADDGASVFSGRSGYTHMSRAANRTEPAGGYAGSVANGVVAPSGGGGYSTIRTRSIRNHPGQSSSALDLRAVHLGGGGESVMSASTEGSYRRSSVYRSPVSVAGSLSPGKSSSRNGHGFASAYSPATSSRASSSRFETLSSLTHSNSHPHLAVAKQPSLPPIPSSSDPAVLAATEREPSAQELRDEIAEIEAEWRRMGESWDGVLEEKVGRWRGEVGEEVLHRLGGMVAPPPSAPAVSHSAAGAAEAERKREGEETVRGKKSIFRRASFNITSPSLNSSIPSSSAPTPSPLPPPSTVPLPAFLLPPPSSSSSPPSSHPPPPSSLPPDLAAHLPDSLLSLTHTLIADVSTVRERKKHTDEAYERRVGFLRSRLRGAEIREGMMKR
ncbi:hypothetical protein JCM6882_004550 [Rhodosporidiobolus microsporus]